VLEVALNTINLTPIYKSDVSLYFGQCVVSHISTNLLKSKISQLTVIGMSLLCQIKSFLFEYYAFITRDDVYYALDLQLPMQSVPITTKVVSSFEACSWRGVLDTTLCDKVCQ
jgi:hypothetical protein